MKAPSAGPLLLLDSACGAQEALFVCIWLHCSPISTNPYLLRALFISLNGGLGRRVAFTWLVLLWQAIHLSPVLVGRSKLASWIESLISYPVLSTLLGEEITGLLWRRYSRKWTRNIPVIHFYCPLDSNQGQGFKSCLAASFPLKV